MSLNRRLTGIYKKVPKGVWTTLKVIYVISEILYALIAFNDDRRYSRKATRWIGRKAGSREPKRWLE
jgi:hypothetical protein|tara:strand:- start:131 stop:331 length:201 start_codon:yes stop_codon:yes gene_type:complete